MIKQQVFIAAALFSGVAIGYFAGGRGNVVEPADKGGHYVAKAAVADKGEAASIQALRARISDLERLLAEKGERTESVISNAVAEAVGQAKVDAGPRGNMREWMENIRKTDPARYTQMTNRFAQWRQRRAEQAQSKIEFLSSIDTSHMSAEARQVHVDLQELIARREELEERLHQEDVSDDQRQKLWGEMRELGQEERRLNGQERNNLLREVARNLGFKGKEVKEITATIRDVIEATDGGFGGGHGGHGGHRGPPPGGRQGDGPRGR